jgi:hypothetical protein
VSGIQTHKDHPQGENGVTETTGEITDPICSGKVGLELTKLGHGCEMAPCSSAHERCLSGLKHHQQVEQSKVRQKTKSSLIHRKKQIIQGDIYSLFVVKVGYFDRNNDKHR